MECAERLTEPLFADADTIRELLGVPDGTLRELARDMIVAAHKLGQTKQSKTVYLFSDVKNWVTAQPPPEWVGQRK